MSVAIKPRYITVYKGDPVWDKHSRWFNVSIHDLNRLYVTTYELSGDVCEFEIEQAAMHVRELHPDTVLVY